ncbi:MAG: hypothetical protein R2847_12595 [Bacteroidia bacterium]
MKKIVTHLSFIVCMHTAIAQKPNVDSILQKVAIEKDEDKKVDLLVSLISSEINNDPKWTIETGLKLLNQSKVKMTILNCQLLILFRTRVSATLAQKQAFILPSVKKYAGSVKHRPCLFWRSQKIKRHISIKTGRNMISAIDIYLSATAHAAKGKMKK